MLDFCAATVGVVAMAVTVGTTRMAAVALALPLPLIRIFDGPFIDVSPPLS